MYTPTLDGADQILTLQATFLPLSQAISNRLALAIAGAAPGDQLRTIIESNYLQFMLLF